MKNLGLRIARRFNLKWIACVEINKVIKYGVAGGGAMMPPSSRPSSFIYNLFSNSGVKHATIVNDEY